MLETQLKKLVEQLELMNGHLAKITGEDPIVVTMDVQDKDGNSLTGSTSDDDEPDEPKTEKKEPDKKKAEPKKESSKKTEKKAEPKDDKKSDGPTRDDVRKALTQVQDDIGRDEAKSIIEAATGGTAKFSAIEESAYGDVIRMCQDALKKAKGGGDDEDDLGI